MLSGPRNNYPNRHLCTHVGLVPTEFDVQGSVDSLACDSEAKNGSVEGNHLMVVAAGLQGRV
jgi:hypothetical protein